MDVCIIGAGYVGLVTGAALAYTGHKVTCIDNDGAKISALQRGAIPIHEPGLAEILRDVGDRIQFVTGPSDLAGEADLIMIAVGTPTRSNGQADISYVEAAAAEVAAGLKDGRSYTLIVKSTVPIGTNHRVRHVVRSVLRGRHLSTKVDIVANPEFLSEGRALADALYPDRIVVGAEDDAAAEPVRRLYQPVLDQDFAPPPATPRPSGFGRPPLLLMDPTSAETVKYGANAFLALKISFINEMAGFCERVGADVTDVAWGLGADPRIGPRFLGAGVGWGGSCFPKDTLALLAMAAEYGYSMPIVEATRAVNARQHAVVVEKLQAALKVLRGRTVGVLGLSFKPDTDDVREAPALAVIHGLVERGAHVRAHDPLALKQAQSALQDVDVEFFADPYELARDADALLITTEWSQYRDLDLPRLAALMRTPVLVDGRNIYDAATAQQAGFQYAGIGR